ncbi:MAG TPA: winged helix-turn-helix transcriptional regulator [Streptomyces sp.]
MSIRTYGQFCGLARALEIVGERWAMLVVRDLVLGPKRFTDLQDSLKRIPTSILTARLNELEESGVIRRRVLPQLDAAVVYELTDYGSELDKIVIELASWGGRSLGKPQTGQVFTRDGAILSLYAIFRPETAKGVHLTYEIRHPKGLTVHALVEDGDIKCGWGSHPDADLVIEPQGAALVDLYAGDVSASEAVHSGKIKIEGRVEHLELFAKIFHVTAAPKPVAGLAVH